MKKKKSQSNGLKIEEGERTKGGIHLQNPKRRGKCQMVLMHQREMYQFTFHPKRNLQQLRVGRIQYTKTRPMQLMLSLIPI